MRGIKPISIALIALMLIGLGTVVPAKAETHPVINLVGPLNGNPGGPYMEIWAFKGYLPLRAPGGGGQNYYHELYIILADEDGRGYRSRARNMEVKAMYYYWEDENGYHVLVWGLRYTEEGGFDLDPTVIHRSSGYLNVRPLRHGDMERARAYIRGIDDNSRVRLRTYMVCSSGPLIYRISLYLWMRGQVYDSSNGETWIPSLRTDTIRVRIGGYDREGGNLFGDWYVYGYAYHYLPG